MAFETAQGRKGKEWFSATSESEEEATALYALYLSRVDYQRRLARTGAREQIPMELG